MKVYIYNADIYCEKCGREIRGALGQSCDTGDSGDYPQGPYYDGGGESDCPQNCGGCGLFLENPLTEEGYDYVREVLQTGLSSTRLDEWLEFYELEG